MDVIIYHNPGCSKSRATLELLRGCGIEPTIIHYLDTPPGADRLAELAAALGLEAQELIRTGEPTWASLELDAATAAPELLYQAMAEHPVLIQRPIVVVGDQARIGRPPEAVLELLKTRC